MPFLFVDYDQGCGGEYFCLELSKSPRCKNLPFTTAESGRVKIKDLFNQEWLKPFPAAAFLESDPDAFDVIPTHRRCHLARELIGDFRSIRIKNPEGLHLRSFVKENQRKKVLLSQSLSDEYFFGELKILLQSAADKKFISRCKRDMDYATLSLLSQGLEPTDENKVKFIKNKFDYVLPEPEFKHDIAIEFEDLIFDRLSVIKKLNDTFDLHLPETSLARFREDYFRYALST